MHLQDYFYMVNMNKLLSAGLYMQEIILPQNFLISDMGTRSNSRFFFWNYTYCQMSANELLFAFNNEEGVCFFLKVDNCITNWDYYCHTTKVQFIHSVQL